MPKLEWWGYENVKKVDDVLSYFTAIHERDIQTLHSKNADCSMYFY